MLVAAGPELAPQVWETAVALARDGLLDALLVAAAHRPPRASGPRLPEVAGVRIGYLDELAAGQDSATFAGELPRSTDLAALFHTGGTTGAPKLAAHTHANEVADAWMIAAISRARPGCGDLRGASRCSTSTRWWSRCWRRCSRGSTWCGPGPLGYREPALFARFWTIVEHYRIAAMSAVPTVYAALAQVPVDADISSLRLTMVGASPLPAAVARRLPGPHRRRPARGLRAHRGHLRESARSFPDAPRPGSVGQRLPYQRVKAVRVAADGTWEDLPAGQVGVLAISGPTVFPGYVVGRGRRRPPSWTGSASCVDGWLDTGDLARVDGDGFVHLAGRAKDLIIRGGHNIDPAIVEDALLAHPQVTAAGGGRPARPARRRGARRLREPRSRAPPSPRPSWPRSPRERVAERAAAPKAVTVARRAAGHRRRQALQAPAARRRRPQRAR